ncbi:MAG TPA: DUF2975 domain-containing protein [Clostridia bacterium]|nr:DUF2975 domain-containing protein [Clostridia bacterium]HXK72085.1 DUF2975 domain-containing protein [Clostridia bacterium]
MKVPNLVKYSKLSKSTYGIINVLFWILFALTILVILLTIATRVFPNIINLSDSDGSFRISPDNIIQFEISTGAISNTRIVEIYSLMFAGSALLLILILLVLSQLKIILKNVVNKNPFAEKNAKSIKNIGYVIMASSLVMPVTKAFLINKIIHAFNLSNVNVVYTVNIEVLIIGILLLLVSAIFNYGAYLQQEYDTTL